MKRIDLLPGLAVGAWLPLLASTEPAHFFRWLPAGLAAGVLLAGLLGALARRRGVREETLRRALLPLALLPVSHLALLVPLPALPFLAGGGLWAVVARRLVRGMADEGADPRRLERAALLVPFCLLFPALFQVNVIHDAFQYLAILASAAFDGDLDFYNNAILQNAERFYNPFAFGSARYLGVPLLEAPFLAVGHFLRWAMALAGSWHAPNGMTFPYQLAISLATSLFGLGALLLSYLLCREWYGREASLVGALGLWLASPLPFFTFSWNGWSHPFNACGTALFLLAWARTRRERDLGGWLGLGLLGGVLLLIRPVNALLAIFPLWDVAAGSRHGDQLRGRLAGALAGGVAALALFTPQLALWRETAGRYLADPYREVGDSFRWLSPDLGGILFDTARHGLLAWTPLYLPAFLGLFLLARRDRAAGWLAVGASLAHLYVYASWSVWWTGIGFSNRFFADLLPVLAPGAAALAHAALRRRFRRDLPAAILGVAAVWNLFLMGAYRALLLPYGIPDPGRVTPSLTFADLARAVLVDFPERWTELFSSHWSNPSFFGDLVGQAVAFRRGFPAAMALLTLAAGWGAFSLLARVSLARGAGAFLRRRLPAFAAAAALAVVGTHAAVRWAGSRTLPTGGFLRMGVQDLPVRRNAEDVHLYPAWDRPASGVDLVTSLAYGHGLRTGTPVALVTVTDDGGRPFDFTLRAGIDTAEASVLRPESRRHMRHDLDRVEVVREEMTGAYSRSRYPAVACLARLGLPEPVRVRSIRLRGLTATSELLVKDVFLRDF